MDGINHLLERARSAGVTITVSGENLFIEAEEKHRSLVAELQRRKPEVLRALDPQPAVESGGQNAESNVDEPDWPDELDSTAMIGPVGEVLRTVGPHSEADPAAILIQFLTAFGSIIGRNPYFRAEADHHFANLFCCLVGNTSKGRKGSSWGQVLRILRHLDQHWCDDCLVNGLSTGEGLIWQVRDEIRKQEPVREGGKRTGRVTGYEDVIVDSGVSDKRLLVQESEFASVLQVAAREKNTLSAVMRQAWDSGNLRSMSKNAPGRATGAHISIVGHITRDELRKLLTTTDCNNGLANRFLWCCVKRSKLLPEGGNLHEADVVGLAARISEAVTFAQTVSEVRRDDDAKAIWHEVYPTLSTGHPGLLGATTSRAEAQTMRLALIYALLDRSNVIRAEHLLAGLAVWRYAEQSARYLFGNAVGDDVANRILDELVKRQSTGMTRTEIRDLFGRHLRKERIDDALELLRELGKARIKPAATGGRNSEVWFAR